MSPRSTPEPFFGVPVRMPRANAERLLAALAEAWEGQYGALGAVAQDLGTMYKDLFRPVAREQTLREAIARAAQVSAYADLPPALCLDIGAAQVITPEARVVIDVLRVALEGQPGDPLDLTDAAIDAERLLLGVYRQWSRERLHKVVAMAAGDDAPLLPAALGLVVMLLLEGAVSRETALVQARPGEPDRDERAVITGVVGFAGELEPNAEWDKRHFTLYGGYALTEARRRLRAIVLEPTRRLPDAPPKRVYIQSGERDAVIAFIARDLRRRGIGSDHLRRSLTAALEAHGQLAEPERAQLARARAPRLLDSLWALSETPWRETRYVRGAQPPAD